MKTKRLWWVLTLAGFWVVLLCGHCWWHVNKPNYTQKPVNYDKDTTLINHSELKPLNNAD